MKNNLKAIFITLALSLSLCGCVTNPDGSHSFDWVKAEQVAQTAKQGADSALVATGLDGSPIGILISSIFGLSACGFGAMARFKTARKNSMRETAIESIKFASSFIEDENMDKFLAGLKQIQNSNKTREEIASSLTAETRVKAIAKDEQ